MSGTAGTRERFFQLRINANLREENFKSASRKARSRAKAPYVIVIVPQLLL